MNLDAYRSEFPITAGYAFLDHAAVSATNRRVRNAVQQFLDRMGSQTFYEFMPDYVGLESEFKARVATLIGAARSDEIAPMANTAEGINIAANSLPLRAGDNVLIVDGDYPANVYPWLNLAPRGVFVKWVPQRNGGLDLETLAARVDQRTRVIAVSTAMFATGYKNDIAAVGRLCKERGIYFVVDGIQTLGAFPLNVQECHIDFLACGAQKWLLSTPGGGFLYCRHGLLDDLQLGAYVGASSVTSQRNFLDYNFTLQPTSDRFRIGTPNMTGIAALHASLGLLLEVGIGQVSERILSLTTTLIGDLEERGYRVVSNQTPERRSGIVIVDVPNLEAAHTRLLAAHVITSLRGGALRIAPHFYNSEEDIMRVGEVLGDR